MSQLKSLKDEIEKCVRCGTCGSVCPTFQALGKETASARGKLTLVQAYLKGEIELSEDYIRHIKECTLCGACRSSCPNGVNTTGIISAARADHVEKKGVPLAASLLFKTLLESSSPWALKLATKMQGLFFKDASIESGLLSRFSIPLIGNGRLMPQLARTFFLEMPEVKKLSSHGRGGRKPKIAFYAGCGVNYLMPNVGIASLDVLKRADVEVIVPSGQVCCGMPAYSMGDVAVAKSMAIKNLEAFEAYDFDFIATSCATCGYGLKTLFKKLLGDDPEYANKVDAFAAKVKDITELLAGELDFIRKGRAKKENSPAVVTYHDPCHLGRNQGVREEPRELIASAKGVELKEMKHPCRCCGLGGGLSISNYGLSMEITRRKAESVRDSGADIVVTACPGCIVQLRDGLHRYGVKAKVAHVVEFL